MDEFECFFDACPSLKATYRDLQGGWLRKYQMLKVTPALLLAWDLISGHKKHPGNLGCLHKKVQNASIRDTVAI